jgi:hypothetical protein
MALGRTLRRLILTAAIVGGGGFAAMNPGAVKAFYEDIYPSDPAKREALELCFVRDHKFNRLDSDQRDACYRTMLASRGEVAAQSPDAQSAPNFVDLQRAAGRGSLPRNDIRRTEETRGAAHPPPH